MNFCSFTWILAWSFQVIKNLNIIVFKQLLVGAWWLFVALLLLTTQMKEAKTIDRECKIKV